jgi:hypothetical protein
MKKLIYFLFVVLFLVSVKTTFSQPQTPILISPVNNATNVSLFPTFDWYDATGASSYRIQIFQGASVILDQAGITQSTFTIVSAILNPNTDYYWRVNATGTTGTSGWSTVWNFTTSAGVPSAPNLVSPANGATNVSATPTMDWDVSSGANQYRIQISTNSSFSTTVVDVAGITNSQYVVQTGALNNGVQYYWRVNATGTGGTSGWSSVWNFTTIAGAPAAPLLVYPTNGSANISPTVALDWSDVPLAETYNVQVSLSPTFSSIVYDQGGITTSTYTMPSGILSGLTMYYWRVNATNVGGTGDWSNIWGFTTAIAPPAAPVLVAPSNGATNVSTYPLLDWNNVSGAQTYRVQVSTTSSFSTTVINVANLTTSQYQVNPGVLQYNTTYYWRVNATNAGGTGLYSQSWSFTTTVQLPPAPTLIYPANNATGIPLSPTFDWSDVSTATSYRIQVSANNGFTSIVIDQTVTTSGYTTLPGVLNGSTQYFWRVAAINNAGQGNYSSVYSFTTQQTMYLSIKVLLEGYFNGSSQVSDTVKIYLANSASPFNFRDSSQVILNTSGTGLMSFGLAPNGNYYIVIKHRNHIETWSSLPVTFNTGSTASYDFSTAASKAYGNNMKSFNSVWVLYGGDCENDGSVNAFDYNLLRTEFGKDLFNVCDLNGDTYVDGFDVKILFANFGKSKARPY